jgi:hypothetical protein
MQTRESASANISVSFAGIERGREVNNSQIPFESSSFGICVMKRGNCTEKEHSTPHRILKADSIHILVKFVEFVAAFDLLLFEPPHFIINAFWVNPSCLSGILCCVLL